MRRDDLGCQLAKTLSADSNLGLEGFAVGIGMAARAKEWQLALHLFESSEVKLGPSVVCCSLVLVLVHEQFSWNETALRDL